MRTQLLDPNVRHVKYTVWSLQMRHPYLVVNQTLFGCSGSTLMW
jgi:hypothetical protein